MLFTNLLLFAVCLICALIIGLFANWSFRQKDSIPFWEDGTVNPEEIIDLPAYNRANGLMWLVAALCMLIAGIVGLFNAMFGVILIFIFCIPGLVLLIILYQHIQKKYCKPEVLAAQRSSKVSNAINTAIYSFIGIICIAIGITFFYTQKEPQVMIHNNSIQIKSMYGTTINTADITNILLMKKSMDEIGINSRINGATGFGDSLKGYFLTDSNGEALLFVRADTSPTIRIGRKDNKDIYISYHDSNRTNALYLELKQKLTK